MAATLIPCPPGPTGDRPDLVNALTLRRLLRRRHRLVAVLSLVLALGVLTHHAMPEVPIGSGMTSMGHHDGMGGHDGGLELMAMCLGLAAAVGLWALARLPRWRPTRAARSARQRVPVGPIPAPRVLPRARAGPLHMVVLRL